MLVDMKKCNVCFEKRRLIISVQKSDKNNINWFTKLQDVIPELEWLEKYVICKNCTAQLEKAWEFKKFVLSREKDQKDTTNVNVVCLNNDTVKKCDNTQYVADDKKDVNCEMCLKTFTTAIQFQQHNLQIHSEQLPEIDNSQSAFTCYNCNDNFNIKENLISHIENEHKRAKSPSVSTGNPMVEEIFQSEDCDTWEKLRNGDFVVERNTHSICKNEFDHEELCQQFFKHCGENFESVEELNLHNLAKHSVPKGATELTSVIKKRRGRKPLRKFNCEICNEEFGYVKLVIEHCTSIHAMDRKIVKPYSCEKCDMRFVSSANLDQHRNYHNKNRTHICSLCGKGFITKSDLTVHEYTHYNRRNYKCAMCDKAFNTNKNLRTHNLVVHTDRSLWKYSCSVCEKRFPLKTNYDQHVRRHTGEKDYVCHICKKPFISKSELQRHIHMHSNIRAFKCTNCDKEYKERRTYQVHLAKKHGIGNVKITVREKKFVCHICPSQFYDKHKLMRHICSHSGLKPFPCYACDKKFTDKSYLKHHLKTAHNIVEQSKSEEMQ